MSQATSHGYRDCGSSRLLRHRRRMRLLAKSPTHQRGPRAKHCTQSQLNKPSYTHRPTQILSYFPPLNSQNNARNFQKILHPFPRLKAGNPPASGDHHLCQLGSALMALLGARDQNRSQLCFERFSRTKCFEKGDTPTHGISDRTR